MPLWLPLVLIGGLVVGAGVAMAFWDRIRNRVFAWAHRNCYGLLQRVVLRIDTIVGRTKLLLRVLAQGHRDLRYRHVSEEEVAYADLPEEVQARVRRHRAVEVDATEQVLEQGG